ncbi:MAG: circularly permuted type 2 ATP-grasp protein [Rhodospirillaceae bacterium]
MPESLIFDEMRIGDGGIRAAYAAIATWLDALPDGQLAHKAQEAEILFRRMGITFLVYGREGGNERLIPFDVIPRVFTPGEWDLLAKGSIQRVRALNMFLADLYHEAEIVRAGKIPGDLVFNNEFYQIQMHGLAVPGGVYTHIAGIDLVRVNESEFYVLEDNLRSPSGVSYMLENRAVMMRLFPDLFSSNRVAPVDHYPDELLRNLRAVSPPGVHDPVVALLTPGSYNSAYFEHAYLAESMGIELVEPPDLFVRDNRVFMRTTEGPQRVDVIYRRIDDDFIDPLAFRADSMLGVPGLLSVYRSGGVTIANAMGTGVADDKSVYPYVPEIVRFYLGEEPILNNVPTYMLRNPDDLKYTLDHLPELVVKEVHGSGGYGMLVGPASTKAEIEAYRARILEDPAGFIAQPTLSLSTCPTYVDAGIAPRHVDLRPYVLSGEDVTVVPGGLTRVALTEGSLVVNSSQGGGTKDTWVLQE